MLGLGASGSAVKLFEPNDISSCVLAFHASTGVSFTNDSGTLFVDSWADQAGTLSNGSRIFATNVGTKRPVFDSQDPKLTFDGSNDRLDLNEADGTDVEITLNTELGFTLLAVYTSSDWSAGNEAIFGDPDNSQNFFRHKPGTPNQFEVKINNNVKRFDLNNPSTLTNNRFHSVMLTASAGSTSTLTCYIDGIAQSDTETINSDNDMIIEQLAAKGSSESLGGAIKHIVVYNKELHSSERELLRIWHSYM